ncbi:MAG: UDP-glucose dehydrogenase family protein [Candidatus Nanopelagicales bacterium]
MSETTTEQLPTLTVIGTGYLGAVHAACMANFGYDVLGVDVDEEKIAALAAGEAPFYEPGLDEALSQAMASGRLRFTTDFARAAEFGDVHFLCVGTPQQAGSNAADVSHVNAAAESLAVHMRRPALVVGKSTVPVGTAARLKTLFHKLAPAGDQIDLAWNPEFLREGFAVADTNHPDRLVVGVDNDAADELLRVVYRNQINNGVPYLRTDLATAELVKVAANSFLATKISFINAMAEVCDKAGADVTQLANAIGYDERIGSKFLRAGLGFGGGCLPKDIRAFMARAGELGVDDALLFLREIDDINLRQRRRAIEIATKFVGGDASGVAIAALGAAFKPDSDDVRDSPALDVAAKLHLQGADVRIYDPKAMDNAAKVFPTLTYASSAEEACRGADLVLLLTEWNEFSQLDPVALRETVNTPRILDGRNALDADKWRAAGWTYHGLGRP